MIIITNSREIQDSVLNAIDENIDGINEENVQIINNNSTNQDYEKALKYSLAKARNKSKDKASFDGYVKRHLKILSSMECKDIEEVINNAEKENLINILDFTSIKEILSENEVKLKLEGLKDLIKNMTMGVELAVLNVISNNLSAKFSNSLDEIKHHEFVFLSDENDILKYFCCCLRCNKHNINFDFLMLFNRKKYMLNSYSSIFTLNNTKFINFIKNIENNENEFKNYTILEN